jgi:hypothetical protein
VIKSSVRAVVLMIIAVAGWSGAASAQTLPSGWSTADVGAVGASGSGSGSGGAFTVAGAGADIWGSADAFRFVYQPMTGDGSIVTRVSTLEYVADWTKAGVMMRDTLAPGSAQATMLVSANKGLAFQRRRTLNGTSVNTSGGGGTAPRYVKLTRAGNTFSAFTSIDGIAWTAVGSDTISMAQTIYVGLAVSSHVSGTLATATFSSTTVTAPPPATTTSSGTTETLVFMRHGEKPSGGYGQITCQGLQRALALPDVLTSRFGTPQFIFAPNPAAKVTDSAGSFDYVRPLATIEPTAIRLGLPVNAQYGYTNISGLQAELTSSTYASSTVFIAWEHIYLQQIVQNLMNTYGGGATVPSWASTDYDSLYIVRLTNDGGTISATFEHAYEGLNGLSTSCP